MPLFNTEIIKSELSENKVFEFSPPKLELNTPQVAMDYLERVQKEQFDFRMSDEMQSQTGIKQIESAALQEKIEEKVVEKLQDVQENAYQQAYELGLEEGRKFAFEKAEKTISNRISELDVLISEIKNLKEILVQQNEAHLVKFTFFMATKIAMKEVQENPDLVINIMRQAIQMSQSEEEVLVQVPASQIDFLEQFKKESNREYDFIKKVKFEPHEDMSVGGCVIQTNYGEVDARLEERINKLWTQLQESMPKVVGKVAS